MPRLRFNPKTGEWNEVVRQAPRARIYLHTDTIDPLWHPADGRVYDSKSAFREATRASGCVERGHDTIPERDNTPNEAHIKDAVERAFSMVEQGYKPKPIGGANEDCDAALAAGAEQALKEAPVDG